MDPGAVPGDSTIRPSALMQVGFCGVETGLTHVVKIICGVRADTPVYRINFSKCKR